MTTETEKTVREISEDIARRGLPFSAFRNEAEWKQTLVWLRNEINKALRDRDERAAKIAERWLEGRVAKSWTSTQTANGIASAIRGKQ